MAESIEQLIRRIATEEGVNPDLAVAIARQESGLNPKAYNGKGESSVGLFQLNQNGGMGSGYDRATLENPEFNARIALRSLARTQAQRPNLDPGALAAASQRPFDPAGYARSVNAMLGGSSGAAHTGSPFSPNGPKPMDPIEADLIGKLQAANAALEQHASKPQPQTNGAIEAWKADRKRLEDLYDAADKRLEDYRKEQRTSANRSTSTASQVVDTDSSDQFILRRNPDGSLMLDAQGAPVTIPNPNYRAPAQTASKTPEQLAAESAANIGQSNAAAAASAASANRINALLPVELIKAQADARAAQLENQRNDFVAAITRQFVAGEIDEAAAKEKVAQYDAISADIADRLAANTEARMRDALNETIRANQAAEQSRVDTLAEQQRSNASREQLDRLRLDSEQANRDATLDLTRRREEREAAEGAARTRTDQVRAATDALGQYAQTGIASAPFQAGIAAALAPLMSLPGAADAAKAMGWNVPSIAPPAPVGTPTPPAVTATKTPPAPPAASTSHVFLPASSGPNPIPDLATQAAQSHTFLPL